MRNTRILLNALHLAWMALAGSVIAAAPASAHVKWFCAYNIATTPRALGLSLNGDFGHVLAIAFGVLLAACIVERTMIGRLLLTGMDGLGWALEGQTERMVRATYGAFFVCLWWIGGIILTPELKTGLGSIAWLQLTIALGLLWRPTMLYSAFGMVVLFSVGLHDYGLFHMLDYQFFFSTAGYFALSATGRRLFGLRPFEIARWGIATSLMWGAVEKFAYPQWYAPLLAAHPELTIGLRPDFFLTAAGLVEFSLAFALVCTPLIRRSAAVILTTMFATAVLGFGKIDALGHAPIVVVLLGTALESAPATRRNPLAVLACYVTTLAFFIICYYGIHYLTFGPALAAMSRLEGWPAAVLGMGATSAVAWIAITQRARRLTGAQ
jgi:hypothetical protein